MFSTFGGGVNDLLSLGNKVSLISPNRYDISHNTNPLLPPSDFHPNGKDIRSVAEGTYMDGVTPSYMATTYNIVDASYESDPNNHSLLKANPTGLTTVENINYW